jgi:hypothetical protein
VRYDSGEFDAFEFDELVHRYKRATEAVELLLRFGRARADGCEDDRMVARAGGPA